jgi:tetratricopeptide (TPR) repeat protein
MVKGVVKDMQGQPVDGAKVVIEMTEGTTRKFETKSNKKGEFIQIGLPSGAYRVTAEKDKLASNSADVRVRVNSTAEANLVIGAAAAMAASKEAVAKNAELKATLEAGIAASNAGNDDEAIAKFTHATELKPDCADCFYNVALLLSKKKEYDKSEAAYKKAIELKPDYGDAYNGLANIYNAQRKFDQAAAASAKASELAGSAPGALAGGNADALFNQGVILWNAGKVADAKKQFEAAIAAKPDHAEAHYQLGMALVNENSLPAAATEFETYLKLAPTGPNAATAKGILGSIKK